MEQHEKSVRKYINKLEDIALISTSLFIGTTLEIIKDFGGYIHGFGNVLWIIFQILLCSFLVLLFLGLINHLYFKRKNDVYDEAYYDYRRDHYEIE